MSFVKHLAPCLVLTALTGCAPASRITLLPEEGGRTSAVEIKTQEGSVLLATPYQTASVAKSGRLRVGETSADAVRDQYKLLLAQRPAAAMRFTLLFAEGARLTPESDAQIPQIILRASERPGAEIFVTGHTDSVGSGEANDALSLQRAQSLRERLIAGGFNPELIEAIGRGERELLIPTADEVEEPRNRRVEIVVR